jgi:hypothetical protein
MFDVLSALPTGVTMQGRRMHATMRTLHHTTVTDGPCHSSVTYQAV